MQPKASIFFIVLLLILANTPTYAQLYYGASVYGNITDELNQPLESVAVYNSTTGETIYSNANGDYTMRMRAGLQTEIQFRLVGYFPEKRTLRPREGDEREVNVSMTSQKLSLPTANITAKRSAVSITSISPKAIEALPSVTGGVEAAIKTLPGVVSNNELSSQYSVRGGNFDENLIYVNDFEIYRPFLIRSGQQEGLSFINADMVSGISFSAGGFEAKYGDRLSSVLDIKYRKPSEFKGNIAASLLGFSGFVQGTAFNRRNTFMLGIRQRANRYLLNSLPTKGQYTPSFTDFQGFITHQFTDNLQLQVIGNYARNRYTFFPEESAVGFGTFDASYRLTTAYEGQEADSYENGMAGASLIYTPNNKLTLKWLASTYASREIEAYNILGFYYIGEVEKDFSSDDFGDVTTILGVGTSHDWARNKLNVNIANTEHRGYWQGDKHFLSWGAKFQRDIINDKLYEWSRADSADFTLPTTNPQLTLNDVLRTNVQVNSNRYTAFVQDEITFGKQKRWNIVGGARINYWDFNKETIISPRFQFGWQPKLKQDSIRNARYERTLSLRGALGAYYQPPIYREMRRPDGTVNNNIKAQKSLHAILGSDYSFTMLNGRPFKLTTELYYKYLWDMVSYGYDNLLIRYSGTNDSKGYAAGIDMRLFGEFVKGTDSWISLSVMQTNENLDGDFYNRYRNAAGQFIVLGDTSIRDFTVVDTVQQSIGYIPRPADQRVTFGMFFQDQLPNNPNFKVHLTLLVGTGLPFGPPNSQRWRNQLRIPPYRRLDIGFSALLFDKNKKELASRNPLRHFESVWASLEIFNVLGIKNTVSYNWIKAIAPNYQEEAYYAVPNYLTARLLNARILIKF